MKAAHQNDLEAIFVKHYKEWCLLSFGYLEDKAEAEDVVQDVFVKLLLREKTDDIVNLRKYVRIAIRNTSFTRAKFLKKERKSEWLPIATPSFESDIVRVEMAATIYKEIEALPEQSRKVFKLCVLDGQKYENAADTLGISVNTVKYHLKKSFKSLRLNLRSTYYFFNFMVYSIIF